ncbi:anthranilate phosphoribosyltransferase, partial [Bacillus velezensis]
GLANDLKEGTKTALEAIQNGDAKRQLERLKQKEEEMYA